MTKMEYAQEIAKKITGADVKEIEKANGVLFTAVQVPTESANVKACIYIDEFYADGLTVEEATENVMELIKKKSVVKVNFDLDYLNNFDAVKDKLTARLYNKATSAPIQRSADKYGFEDLIIVPAIQIDACHSTRVTKDYLNLWGVTADEVLDIAEQNSSKYTKMMTMMEAIFGANGLDAPAEPFNADEPQLLVVTNDSGVFGAYSIIPLLDSIKAMFPRGFSVLPSSVHEVIVTNSIRDEFSAMVQDVNSTVVSDVDQLSDHSYTFVA